MLDKKLIEEAVHTSFEKLKDPFIVRVQKNVDEATTNGHISNSDLSMIYTTQSMMFSANLIIEALAILFPDEP